MPTFNFPASPAIDEVYEENGVQYVWNGEVWLTGASVTAPPVYVLKAGDTMLGPLMLPGQPTQPLMATDKKYVDETVATNSLYQSTWQVALNLPDLDPAVALPLHGYSWTAVTADPDVPEIAPATLPGIGGLSIGTNDGVKWNANTSLYEHIPTPLNASAMIVADTPPAGAFHGQQWFDSDNGRHYIWYQDVDSAQWVQCSGGGGGSAVGITDAPADGTPYERQDNAWVAAGAGAGGITDAPVDGQQYARQDAAWTIVLGGAVPVSDTAPATPVQGMLWFNSTDASLYLWFDDGTSAQWVEVSASGAGGLTQADADARYLQQNGGPMKGRLKFSSTNEDYWDMWRETATAMTIAALSGGTVNLGIGGAGAGVYTKLRVHDSGVTVFGTFTDSIAADQLTSDGGINVGDTLALCLTKISQLEAEVAALKG